MGRLSSRLGALGAVLYHLGVAAVAVLAFAVAWPDMEAGAFDANARLVASERLGSMRCPWMITAGEVAHVSASFHNPLDREVAFSVRSRISQGFFTLVRTERQNVRLAPGESQRIRWPVTADDAVFERVVMARVLTNRSALGPSRQNVCGILVVGVQGVRGNVLYVGALILALLLGLGGAALWWRSQRPLDASRERVAKRSGWLGGLVIVAVIAAMMGVWPLAQFLLLVGVIMVLALIQHAFGGSMPGPPGQTSRP